VARDTERLRASFNQVAELYDRAPPAYPARLVAALATLAGLIDSRYGGRITMRYLFWLCVARRRPVSR
jgi:hypothetical protein